MLSIVALDIETTGLDPVHDAIIEIGAVRFNGNHVEGEWTSLINPNKVITPFIVQLTGITNDMVHDAPPIQAVIQQLADFVGDSPVLGHNVQFDLSFLRRYKILKTNPVIDTYELASVLLPTASRYNLGALSKQLGVLQPATHRALDDARATYHLFLQLYETGLQLPTGILSEFVRLSESFHWGGSWVFAQALKARIHQPVKVKPTPIPPSGANAAWRQVYSAVASPRNPAQPLNEEQMCKLLEPDGPFDHYFKQFEHREQQVGMLRAISQAFSDGHHLLIEAGTGTGKSFAYLIPAAFWALQNNERVVISTNTINLQDQLIKKDIPDLCRALSLNLRVAVMKGRTNYLCPRRLEALRQRGPNSVDEMRVLGKILVWQLESDSGDRGEINLNGPVERDIWRRLSSEDENCHAENCNVYAEGGCPFYRARALAQSAHLIIVNHALLLADIGAGNRVIPEYSYVVIDEGHHLESATTDALSFKVTQVDVIRLIRELGGTSSGLLGYLLTLLKDILQPAELAGYANSVEHATSLLFRLDQSFHGFFDEMGEFLSERRNGRPVTGYGQEERILPATRALPVWTNVEVSWDEVHDTANLLLNLLAELYKTGSTLPEENTSEDLQDTLNTLSSAYRRLLEIDVQLNGLVSSSGADLIYWAQIQPGNNQLALNVAPLHVGPLMERHLWREKKSVVLTSATLTTNDGFDYLRSRLNAHTAKELQLGSPFDYEKATLLFLVNDIPEPNDAVGYQHAVEQSLIQLGKATQGRMLALFTSYTQLRRTSTNISAALGEAGITVFEQGDGASSTTLLESFRETEKAVLLGTRSFWEGVDVPGDALSVVVIVKLPFDVPSDPIIASRSETFEDPFNEYQIPEAILRFRQGFGRLIRTQTDRGVVAILDKRILTKNYGHAFLDSLPACQVQKGPMRDLPTIAAGWLEQGN